MGLEQVPTSLQPLKADNNLKVVKRAMYNRTTGLYYAGEGRWAQSFEAAKNFSNIEEMMEEVRLHNLGDSCVVVVESENGLVHLDIPLR